MPCQINKCNPFKKYLKDRKMGFDADGLVYTLVLNRLMEPKSELAIHDWSKSLYGIKHPKDLNQWYRALDFLIEHKDSIEKDLFESQKDLFNSDIDIVLMDTTSLVYFGDGDKAEGIPIGHEVYPDNTNDIGAFKEMLRIVKTRFKIRRVIIVCDRGMVSEDNIRTLEADGYEYVVGMRMRQLKEDDTKKILSMHLRQPALKSRRAS